MRLKITSLIIFIIILPSFVAQSHSESKINYREEMRTFVTQISSRAKNAKPGFIVVPQNAMDLITYNGKPDGKIAQTYFGAIDGTGCEELFFGHGKDGERTSRQTRDYFLGYLQIFRNNGKAVLVIDYVTNKKQAYESYTLNKNYGFISFQANRSLSEIPSWIFDTNNNALTDILKANNFLYILNASKFRTPDSYIRALKRAQNDLIVIDAFFWGKILAREQLNIIQKKLSGKKRLVLAYLSIGEAEEYRYYWKREWKQNPPAFLERENPEWKGNYKVKYWLDDWKGIICGRENGSGFENSYLKKIIDSGFDGVYLDILDAAYYFEKRKP